jgi:hypothetical protein
MPRYIYPNPRNTTDQAKRIELPWLLKNDYLQGYKSGNISWSFNRTPTGNINISVNTLSENPFMRLTYKTRRWGMGGWKDFEFEISMENTSCPFGGKKWFFICGFQGCSNRVRILYSYEDYFTCRKCAHLSYESCNMSQAHRSGYFKVLLQSLKADEYRKDKVKRKTYKGRLTKKYKRYLSLDTTLEDQINAIEDINSLLNKTK